MGPSAKDAPWSVATCHAKGSSIHCNAPDRALGFEPTPRHVSQGGPRAWFSAHILGYKYQNEARPVSNDGYECKASTYVGLAGVASPMNPRDALE